MRLVCLLTVLSCLTGVHADDTARIEILPGPVSERFKAQIYARNVWDLQVFDGRLYVGTGNSSNIGPSPNAGPVPIWSLDLASGIWKVEGSVDDEQIEVFRVTNGALTVPGHDPREDWSKGNFYRLGPREWTKTRTITNGIHTYDMAFFAGRLWAGLGTEGDFQLASSRDGGQNWRVHPSGGGRTYTLHAFENHLLGWGQIPSAVERSRIAALKDEEHSGDMQSFLRWLVYEVRPDQTLAPRPDLTTDVLFPGSPDEVWAKLVRPTLFKGQLLYIGGAVHNDHQNDPFGAYAAASLRVGRVRVTPIPLDGEKPWDIEVQGQSAHILTSRKETRNGADRYQISVWSSRGAKTWTRALRFWQPTFARSFARHGDSWYFGLGTDVGAGWETAGISSYTRDLRPEAGTILRVRAAR